MKSLNADRSDLIKSIAFEILEKFCDFQMPHDGVDIFSIYSSSSPVNFYYLANTFLTTLRDSELLTIEDSVSECSAVLDNYQFSKSLNTKKKFCFSFIEYMQSSLIKEKVKVLMIIEHLFRDDEELDFRMDEDYSAVSIAAFSYIRSYLRKGRSIYTFLKKREALEGLINA